MSPAPAVHPFHSSAVAGVRCVFSVGPTKIGCFKIASARFFGGPAVTSDTTITHSQHTTLGNAENVRSRMSMESTDNFSNYLNADLIQFRRRFIGTNFRRACEFFCDSPFTAAAELACGLNQKSCQVYGCVEQVSGHKQRGCRHGARLGERRCLASASRQVCILRSPLRSPAAWLESLCHISWIAARDDESR